MATSAVVLAVVAFASRAGLAEGLMSGFLVEGFGLLIRLGSGLGGPAPLNFFTESATLVTVRLKQRTIKSCSLIERA